MIKTIGSLLVSASLLLVSTGAHADPFRVGGSVDLGVPDGLGVGVVVQPGTKLLRLGLSFQDNYAEPGGRTSVVFAPIKFPVYPELELDGGLFARENLPFAINGNRNLNVQYDYLNMLVGVGIGSRDHFSFTLSGGASYIALNVGNVQQALNISATSVSVGNPSFNGFVPSAKLGVSFFF